MSNVSTQYGSCTMSSNRSLMSTTSPSTVRRYLSQFSIDSSLILFPDSPSFAAAVCDVQQFFPNGIQSHHPALVKYYQVQYSCSLAVYIYSFLFPGYYGANRQLKSLSSQPVARHFSSFKHVSSHGTHLPGSSSLPRHLLLHYSVCHGARLCRESGIHNH